MKILKCSNCGNEVLLLKDGGGKMNCCKEKMREVNYNSVGDREYHIPSYVIDDNNKLIIDTSKHPNTDSHNIDSIIIITNKGFSVRKPDYYSKCYFLLEKDEKLETIFSHCNIHGWWRLSIND